MMWKYACVCEREREHCVDFEWLIDCIFCGSSIYLNEKTISNVIRFCLSLGI
jgi:hypothetical protein